MYKSKIEKRLPEPQPNSEQKVDGTSVSPAIAKPNVIGSPLSELEAKKKAAYDRANEAYCDRNSPHYRDNERYSWAVKTIGEWSLSDCL